MDEFGRARVVSSIRPPARGFVAASLEFCDALHDQRAWAPERARLLPQEFLPADLWDEVA
jgi:hypothetical protein